MDSRFLAAYVMKLNYYLLLCNDYFRFETWIEILSFVSKIIRAAVCNLETYVFIDNQPSFYLPTSQNVKSNVKFAI